MPNSRIRARGCLFGSSPVLVAIISLTLLPLTLAVVAPGQRDYELLVMTQYRTLLGLEVGL